MLAKHRLYGFLSTFDVRSISPWYVVIASLVCLSFLLQSHTDFNLADEGFLWYGAKRVLVGEVPILDFQAYDPVRYYWAAGFMHLLGDSGVVSLRVGAAVCQFATLSLAVYMLIHNAGSTKKDFIYGLLVAILVMMLWMYIYYKIYDVAASILLIFSIARLLEQPNSRRFFSTGFCIGFAAAIGRNHGIYGLFACACAVTSIQFGSKQIVSLKKSIGLIGLGVFFGFFPVWMSMLVFDGYAKAFLESVSYIFEIGSTNLTIPVPWPWLVLDSDLSPLRALHKFIAGLCFIALPFFAVTLVGLVVWIRLKGQNSRPTIESVAWLSMPYAHYAFSRADIPHLSLGIFPMILGLFSISLTLQSRYRLFLIGLIVFFSSLLMLPLHPYGKCSIVHDCISIDIDGDKILIPKNKANQVQNIRAIAHKYSSANDFILITPSWPGGYALLDKKAPTYDIYTLSRRSSYFQEAEIARLRNTSPSLAIIIQDVPNGNYDYKFENTNPLTYNYILEQFQSTATSLSEAKVYRKDKFRNSPVLSQ